MKKESNEFGNNSFATLSEEDMKEVRGGWLYWECIGGMTGQGNYYESWMCPYGLAYIIYMVPVEN